MATVAQGWAAPAPAPSEADGPDIDAGAWRQGRELTTEEALGWILRQRGPRDRPRHSWSSLTPAELAVVKLVATGASSQAIAARLFVSPRTVSTHLSHVYAKLGVASRSELAAPAVEQGLTR